MNFRLRYGREATLVLELDPLLAISTGGSPASALPDPRRAVIEALRTPLDFPTLDRVITPGDRVVVPVGEGVPQAAPVVGGLIQTLLASGADAASITVLLGPASAGNGSSLKTEISRELESLDARGTSIAVHEPGERSALCYLTASAEGLPIYLSRELVEADVVLPVGVARLNTSFGYLGPYAGLLPVFGDDAARARFQTPWNIGDEEEPARRRSECDEAAWLLGVLFDLQLVPAPGGGLAHVVAGESRAVEKRAQQLLAELWSDSTLRQADLVVATVSGSSTQQTWANVARALAMVAPLTSSGALIVLGTGLRNPPTPTSRGLGDEAASYEQLRRRLRRQRGPDAVALDVLVQVREHARIFLLSDLPSEVVEDLGIGCVAEPSEIQHLCAGATACLLVQDAQHAVVQLAGQARPRARRGTRRSDHGS